MTFLKLCWFTNAAIKENHICKCFFTLTFETCHSLHTFFLFTAFPFHCCCSVPGRVCTVLLRSLCSSHLHSHLVSSSTSFCAAPNVLIFFVFLRFGFLHSTVTLTSCGFLLVFSLLRSFIERHRFCRRHRFRSFFTLHQRRLSTQGWWFFNFFLIFFNVMNLFFLIYIIQYLL